MMRVRAHCATRPRKGQAYRSGQRTCSVSVQCVQTPPTLQRITRRAKLPEELQDPAKIGASGTATSTFSIPAHYESLDSYMLLPVEQYFVLDPKQIAHLGGDRFVLTVPRINLFNVWLEAVAEVRVTTYPGSGAAAAPGAPGLGPGSSGPRVVLEAENCRISGSDAVESLKLDQRFCMRFVTELTWRDTSAPAAPAPATAGSGGSGAAGGAAGGEGKGEIRADSALEVWSEVVPPFQLLPREVLVATCNGVLKGLVNSLLPLFVRMLSQDYQRWAVDPAYREERAQRSANAQRSDAA